MENDRNNYLKWINSLYPQMNPLLSQSCWIEEDPINQHSNQILDKLNEVVSLNEPSPVMNVVNWGRSNHSQCKSNTRKTQWSCFIEWIISCFEYSELRKIQIISEWTKIPDKDKECREQNAISRVTNVVSWGRSNHSLLQQILWRHIVAVWWNEYSPTIIVVKRGKSYE